MKQKHVFICESDVYENMRVHVFFIGQSQRELRKRDAILRAASLDKDIYFTAWDCEACEFIRRLSEQIYSSMAPRQAFEKFNENNVIRSSLRDVEDIVKSLPTNTHVTNPEYLNHEIKFWKER